MARGKRLTGVELLNKKISEIDEKINKHKEIIDSLSKQKEDLLKELKIAKLEDISSMIEENGITVDELKTMIEQKRISE